MVNVSKHLENSEYFIRKNKTILLLIFIICLLVLLYVKYHKFTVREGNALDEFQNELDEQVDDIWNIFS